MTTVDDEDFTITSSGELPTTMPPDDIELILRRVETIANAVGDIRFNQESNREHVDIKIGKFEETLTSIQEEIKSIKESQDTSNTGGSGAKVGKRGKNTGGTNTNTAAELVGVRATWDDLEPMLISEGLFAIAKVLSFLRPICFTVMSRHVGPMQISLGGMMFDICKFLLIFSFVWFAFSLGMNQLYSSYAFDAKTLCLNQNDPIANCKQPFDSWVFFSFEVT